MDKQNFLKFLFQDQTLIGPFTAWGIYDKKKEVIVLGDNEPEDYVLNVFNAIERAGIKATLDFTKVIKDPNFKYNVNPENYLLIWCPVPQSEDQWKAFHDMKKKNPESFYGLWEIVSKYAMIDYLLQRISFYLPKEQLGGLYSGVVGPKYPDHHYEGYSGVVKALNDIFPLKGKSVIEFGPLDGAQTITLAKYDTKVTSIELRPENAIKTLVGLYLSKSENVNMILTDYHSVRGEYHGRFDLVFAHGVYYHSEYPLLWFENLISLSDNIFIGGWTANDKKPVTKKIELHYKGQKYRTKTDVEHVEWSTAGVGPRVHYFYKDDLIKFFELNGFKSKIISYDDLTNKEGVEQGGYLRVLFQR